MAKITAVIDIGSNSARMVVFEKTSRFGFYLLREIKSRVRISEDSYENNGNLQEPAMNRAVCALEGFMNIAKNMKANKILAVATSAVRDAPNKAVFINRVRRELGLNIKVIEGEREAYLGAVAAVNLLPVEDGLTIDIGGGSTELALIEEGRIKELYSLNIGTVRLKELFFDRRATLDRAKEYVLKELDRLPASLKSQNIIGIGGTLRALSKTIAKEQNYPIVSIHGFSYDSDPYLDMFSKICASSATKLRKFNIKEDRYDTIREGVLIFQSIIERVGASRVITGGVGVREGVYLTDLLRNSNHLFPKNFNPSVRSLLDRFCTSERSSKFIQKTAKELFFATLPLHNIDEKYLEPLSITARLIHIGTMLNYYNSNRHGAYFLLNALNYRITHENRAIISILLKFSDNRLPANDYELNSLRPLLPDLNTLRWLSFILSVSKTLNIDESTPNLRFELVGQEVLGIHSSSSLYLAKESIRKIDKPKTLAIIFHEDSAS